MTATAILTFYAFILFVFYLYFIFIIQALENLLLGRPPSSWETSSFSFLRKCLVTLVYQNTCVTKCLVISGCGFL